MRTFILVAMATVAASTAQADPTGPPMQVRLELSLTDGSVLYGTPCQSSTSLKVLASFGELSAPLRTIQSFTVAEQGEQVVLHWPNGDKVSGGAGVNGIEVDTVLGKLNVPLSAIKVAKVQLVPMEPPLKPVDVKASGTYAPRHQLEYAYDGKKGTSWSSGGWSGWIEFDLGQPTDIALIEVYLQFGPTGTATHEIYVSDEPMRGSTKIGTLLETFNGTFHATSVLKVNCPPGTVGRYVQVRNPGGRAWFNIRELEIYPL